MGDDIVKKDPRGKDFAREAEISRGQCGLRPRPGFMATWGRSRATIRCLCTLGTAISLADDRSRVVKAGGSL